MADNVAITAGAGTTIATDDVSTVHYQRVKLVDGTLESTTAIASGNGVASGALRVSVASDSTGALIAKGDVAHDAADSGAPVKVGHKAIAFDGTVPGTAVAEADRVDSIADVYGRQFVELTHPNHWQASANYASAQTNTTLVAAPGAGLKLYVTDIVVSNGSTAGTVSLLDGSGGSQLVRVYPAANGGLSTNLRTPLVLTANTLLAVTSVTVTDHTITVTGFTAP